MRWTFSFSPIPFQDSWLLAKGSLFFRKPQSFSGSVFCEIRGQYAHLSPLEDYYTRLPSMKFKKKKKKASPAYTTAPCHFSHRRGAHKSNQNRNHHALLWISDTVSFNKICKYFAVNWFPSFILLSTYLLFMPPPLLLEAEKWWGGGWDRSQRLNFLAFLLS